MAGYAPTTALADWALHWRAHRAGLGLLVLLLLPVSALVATNAVLRLPSLAGPLPVPWVCLPAVLTGAVVVWTLERRTPVELVSTRPLQLAGLTLGWAVVLVPALVALALVPASAPYARAALFTIGVSLLLWRATDSPLSGAAPAVWFVVSTAFSGTLPGSVYWAVYAVQGDAKSWILPLLAAAASLSPLPSMGVNAISSVRGRSARGGGRPRSR